MDMYHTEKAGRNPLEYVVVPLEQLLISTVWEEGLNNDLNPFLVSVLPSSPEGIFEERTLMSTTFEFEYIMDIFVNKLFLH